jgi:Domain of unknown function (DUF4129)
VSPRWWGPWTGRGVVRHLRPTGWLMLSLPGAPPLDPSREQARDWARRELADPAYARASPGLVERAVRWVFDRIRDLGVRGSDLTSPAAGITLLVLVTAVVLVVVLLRTGRLRGPSRSAQGGAVFTDPTRSADEHRRLADAAGAVGDWAGAVRERFRAVVRSLEERVVLDERPGRTAHEAAADAGIVLPKVAAALAVGAGIFDDVVYGERAATAAQDGDLRALDAAVQLARPGPTTPLRTDPAVPR